MFAPRLGPEDSAVLRLNKLETASQFVFLGVGSLL